MMTNNSNNFTDEDETEYQVDEYEIDYEVEADEHEYEREPFSKMRGVCSFDYNGTTIFIRADVEDVAPSLSKHRGANRWQQNIVNQEIELSSQCFFVFQFNGHMWTTIIARNGMGSEDARIISLSLQTRAIYYGISDTACALSYNIYENGELLENLETGECYENIEWKSSIHDLTAEQMKVNIHIETWIDKLFRENDMLEPSLTFEDFVGYIMHKPGHKITIRDTNSMFKRTDFIAL
jgi:hypothetical protein